MYLNRKKTSIFIVLIIVCLSHISIASASSLPLVNTVCTIPTSKFLWNTSQTTLLTIIKQISKLTCQNYIIDKYFSTTSKVSIILQKPISVTVPEIRRELSAFISKFPRDKIPHSNETEHHLKDL